VKFWLLTPTRNQVRRLAILEDHFEEQEEEEQQQEASTEVATAKTGQ
jgi:hypothetical protein